MRDDIILVGNGTSVLDEMLGGKIDEFKTIVRFNSYQTKGYEDFVGSKTHIWFSCNLIHLDEIEKYDEVIFHSWEKEEQCQTFAKIKEKKPDVSKVEKKYIEMTEVKNPSTGLIAIHYFLEKYDKVYIYGFDWWSRKEHHYSDNYVRGTLHNPEMEFKRIQKLGERVQFLSA